MNFFEQYCLNDLSDDIFYLLKDSCLFEKTGKGRLGGNLLAIDRNGLHPIVRTTTKYKNPNQPFKKIHYDLIEKIKFITNKDINFNNAMIELYDSSYKDMQFHTDQSLDLVNDSYICIFSCYAYSKNKLSSDRYLKIENKLDKSINDICLEHNSIILFDTLINKKHLHKIYLQQSNINNQWLGITFRLSKTLIKFVNEIPYFSHNDVLLRLATEGEEIQMRHLKHSENSYPNFTYSYDSIDYTISFSDCIKSICDSAL